MAHSYTQIREKAGLIDLQDWARFAVTGPDACDALDSVIGGNLVDLYDGKAMNTLIPSVSGGVEAILWVIAQEDGYLLLAEPDEQDAMAGVLADLALTYNITVTDRAGTLFHMVLTGPDAEAVAGKALGPDVTSIPFLSTLRLDDGALAIRIGYFGEYELHLVGAYTDQDALVKGLEAAYGASLVVDGSSLSVMMAEMRILNRARDIPAEVSVFQAGLQWMVDFQKGNLRGAEALNLRRDEPGRQAVLVEMDDAPVASQTPIIVEGEEIGTVQSAYHSQTLGKTIALAFLNSDLAVPSLILQTSAGIARTLSAPAFLSRSVLNAMGQTA